MALPWEEISSPVCCGYCVVWSSYRANEGRGAGRDLGPEDGLLQLEFHHAGQLLACTCDIEKPGARVTQNALVADLRTGPQRSAAIGEPLRGFLQDGGDLVRIRGARLLDVHGW